MEPLFYSFLCVGKKVHFETYRCACFKRDNYDHFLNISWYLLCKFF